MKKLYIQKKVLGLMLLSLVFNFSLPGQNIYTVTKTSDPDPFAHPYYYNDALCDTAMYGTLQWAIRKSNEYPDTNYIHFNIPGSGPFIIQLNNYLPALSNSVRIDGATQPGYNYNNGPLIIIDGANIPYNSDCFNISANSSVIKGLLIKNFYISTGIMVWVPNAKIIDNMFHNVGGYDPTLAYYQGMAVYIAAQRCIIQGNVFGTDLNGIQNYACTGQTVYLQSQYKPADSCLIGGSGLNEGNLIAYNGYAGGWAGITIINGKYNRISRNKIYNNALGIALLIYAGPTWWGNEGKSAPVIDTLTPTGILLGNSQPNDIIEIFGSTGTQNANEYLITTTADGSGNWSAVMSNYNWAYFIATATDAANNTSELSNAYEIIIPPPMATCATATEIIITPVCIPQIYYGQTTDLWFKFIPDTANVELFVSYPATAAATIDRMHAYEGACDSLNLYAQTNNDTLYLYDLTPGNTYYLKLRTAQLGYFNICGQKGDTLLIPPDYTVEPPASNGAYYVNKGQIIDTDNNPRPDIKYYSVNTSPALYLTDTAVSFVLAHVDTIAATPDTMHRVDMKLGGNSYLSRPYKREQATGYLNYYLGHCPQGVTNVKGYNRIIYPDVYPNINMQLYSNQNGIKFYFVIKPGGKTDAITLKFNGADAVNITANGNLQIQTGLGNIEFDRAQCYKVNPAGNIVPMPNQGDYVQLSPTEIGFDVQQSAAPMPLIIMVDKGHAIQPTTAIGNLIHSTYSYGNNYDEYHDVTTDNSGNIYITGYTNSTNFPVLNGLQTTIGSSGYTDAIVQKIDQNMVLQWSTYYGGSDQDDARSIAVDNNNDVFFAGETWSIDFPTYFPLGAYKDDVLSCPTIPCRDMFIVKLSSSGASKLWATYYGGPYNSEGLDDIVIDGFGNLYCVGRKDITTELYTQTGASNYTTGGGIILKFDNNEARLWATAIGGSGGWARTVTCDKNNNLLVAGLTTTGLQVINAYQGSLNGTWDAYLVKFDNTNNNVWCTYFGGGGDEIAYGVATDSDDNIYITGKTTSPTGTNFPLINNGYPYYFEENYQGQGTQSVFQGDAFIAEFNSSGTPIASTYYGGNADENGLNIAIDKSNRIYITGATTSANFSLLSTNPLNTFSHTTLSNTNDTKEDAFIISFGPLLQRLWTTYYGGGSGSQGTDIGNGIATYNSRLYVVGGTTSNTNFPLVDISNGSGGVYYYGTLSGFVDGFLAAFDLTPVPLNVENIKKQERDILLCPNPTDGKVSLYIDLLSLTDIHIFIYDITGRVIYNNLYSHLYGNQKINFDLLDFSPSIYTFKIIINDTIINEKIIVY